MTRKMMLIAGVAGIALSAPVSAQKGDKGGGREGAEQQQRGGGGQARAERPQRQQAQRAERPQRMERQQAQRVERPQRIERQQARQVDRQQRREFRQVERPQRVERQQVRQIERAQRREVRQVERPQRIERQQARQVERQQRREIRQVERPQRVERQLARQIERNDRREIRDDRRDQQQAFRFDRQQQRQDARFARQQLRADNRFDRQLIRAAQRNQMRAMPQIRQERISIGQRIAATAFAPVPAMYGTRYADTPDYYYRYDNDYGYVYRINRDNNYVSGLMPLFGGYSIGDPWPSMYRSSYVPYGYQPYYYDTPDYYYRYDGNAIYRIDAGSQMISGIVALLLGQSLGVGQLLPQTYNAYNVPLAYRSSYYDTDDSWYRYGDGYIYQVDPYSRRIEERYPLYADNYMIGQPWPVAYPGYNVPYGYRDLYYDTPQYHYRYANGGIYQVDPTTQLITALVSLVSGQQFGVGQTLPSSYGVYNVPMAYRDRYYDTDDDWYRYADGYVYQVDPDSYLIREAYPIYA